MPTPATTSSTDGPLRGLARWAPLLVPWAVLAWPVPPIQDLAAQGALLEAVARGFGAFWTIGPWYGHSALFYLGGGLLAQVLGGALTARLLMYLALALIPLGTRGLARRLGGDEVLAALGGGVLALGHLSFLGFLPFQVALGVTLCGLPALGRARGCAATAGCAIGASALVWSLHALALPALWIGLWVVMPDLRRRLAALAAVPLPCALWRLTHEAPQGLLRPADPLDLVGRLERVWRFYGSPDPWFWALPGLGLVTLMLAHLAWWRRTGDQARMAGIAFLVFAVLGVVLPDFVEQPRIVHPWLRLAPFAGALLLSSLPRQAVRTVHRGLAAGLLTLWTLWTLVLAGHESRLLEAPAAAIRSLPPSGVLLGVTLHRPQPGSWMRLYAGLHLPFLYQGEGQGRTLAPFTHQDSPVRLAPDKAAVADLALRDVRRYVQEGSRVATMALTDGGDDPTFLQVTGLADLPPCRVPFPPPWRCVMFDAPTRVPAG